MPTAPALLKGDERCPDPYPEGVPFEVDADELIRLRPLDPEAAGSVRVQLTLFRPLPFVRDPGLEQVVLAAIGDDTERFAVLVKELEHGRGAAVDIGRSFYAASLFKPWVMLEAFSQRDAGLLDFGERYIVSDYYGEFGLNPGELEVCDEVTVGEAMERMMALTDNVAANLLLDRVGAGNVNSALRRLGLSDSGFPGDDSLPTTAADTALLLEAIVAGGAVSEAASDEMLALLEAESINDRLPALLPKGTRVAHKTGNWEDATHDAGIIVSPGATYVIVVLTDFGFQDGGAARIARLSRMVYDYYNEG